MNARTRVIATAASLCAAGGLAVAASGATGAYFTDANNGTVTGTIGTVEVSTGGGGGADNLDFNFNNLMPGSPQTAKVTYKNTGSAAQDIYLVFPDKDALHAINQLGEYGEIHIAVDGAEKWASKNLNDGYDCGTPGLNGKPTLCALPPNIELAGNVAPGATGQVTFSFAYSGLLKSYQGASFNTYKSEDGTVHTGLPYQIVATQAGHTPGE